jgi:hypothetical protein
LATKYKYYIGASENVACATSTCRLLFEAPKIRIQTFFWKNQENKDVDNIAMLLFGEKNK